MPSPPSANTGISKRAGAIQLTNLEQFAAGFVHLKDAVQLRVLKKTVHKAMTPVVKDAKQRCPVGSGLNTRKEARPHLRELITKKSQSYKNGVAVGIVGPLYWGGQHAWLVHEGTKPHLIEGKVTDVKSNMLQFFWKKKGYWVVAKAVNHPGARPQRFLSEAVEAQRATVGGLAATTLREEIRKELAKL